jgi:predicted peptidase
VPLNYDESKEYPVVVLLHGAGERGTDNVNQLANMVPNLFNQNKAVIADSIVICPQCPWNNQWVDTPWTGGNYSVDNVPESNELKAVIELIKEVQGKYSCDENRPYAMGLSMGGFGSWDMLMRHTEMFAGAVIMCGGADTSYAEKLKDMPIYTAHGTSDTTTVPYNNSTKPMVDALIKAGNENVIFKPVIGAGHVMWEPFAQDPEVIGWLFEQKQQ